MSQDSFEARRALRAAQRYVVDLKDCPGSPTGHIHPSTCAETSLMKKERRAKVMSVRIRCRMEPCCGQENKQCTRMACSLMMR